MACISPNSVIVTPGLQGDVEGMQAAVGDADRLMQKVHRHYYTKAGLRCAAAVGVVGAVTLLATLLWLGGGREMVNLKVRLASR